VLSAAGHRAEAETVLRDAVQAFEQAASDFPAEPFLRQELAFSRRRIGDLAAEAGQIDEAERHGDS
jgi:hypothetical protein